MAVACAVLLTAAALVPAPPPVVPFLVVVCIACPVFAAWEIPIALAVLRLRQPTRRVQPLDAEAVGELRRGLDSLPETEHPLGY